MQLNFYVGCVKPQMDMILTLSKIQMAQLIIHHSCIQWRHKFETVLLFYANLIFVTLPECGLYLLLLLEMPHVWQNLAAG
jgi:hypothetical protein